MKNSWALQDAKNRFSEVVEHAVHDGPQTITRRGRATAILMSVENYKSIVTGEENLVDFFQASPMKGIDFDIDRVKDKGREVDL